MNAIPKDSFATESGHFYDRDGSPRYTIIGKNGKERNTHVGDARKNGLVPSVTTILKMAAAPGLERWKIGNAILSALTLTRQEGESDESLIARIIRDSEEQAKKARERGTEIHGWIEKGFLRKPLTAEGREYFLIARLAVDSWAGGATSWSAERSFASPLGFGGKLDLSALGLVADFKTTDKPLDGLKTWPEHRRQLAAYRKGLDMPEARCAICYVSSARPEARVIELPEDELKQGWEEFQALLRLYYSANKLQWRDA